MSKKTAFRDACQFNRGASLSKVAERSEWDIIVIGGGATGLGTALDAASRGYAVLLVEQADFAKGTSSRSTKLVHGGVRYLAQGNIGLVYEALHERGLLLRNAPHLVKKQAFVIPCYSQVSKVKYLIGLKIYDWLSGSLSFGRSKALSKGDIIKQLPELKTNGLISGIEYWDGQFDDARLAVNIARTCAEKGGIVLNYFKVTGLLKTDTGKINGVIACDTETQMLYHLKAKTVINATGVFVDDILQMDTAESKPMVRPSQGIHIVLKKTFLSGSKAIMIPETTDGRVLFAVPWHGHVLVGTTDTALDCSSLEPLALQKEIAFILDTAGKYLVTPPGLNDIMSVFAGLRPLAISEKKVNSTKEISRSHKLVIAGSGLITITGGKWTTYRKMAEDTIDAAIRTGKLRSKKCKTSLLKIHGNCTIGSGTHLAVYGTDEQLINTLIKNDPQLGDKLHPSLPDLKAEVIWAVREEMARTVEDVLARRLRTLFLDAGAAIDMAPGVAGLIAAELKYDQKWQDDQVRQFVELANQYLPIRPMFN